MSGREQVWNSEWLYLRMETLRKGLKECLGPPDAALVMHIGHSLELECRLGGRSHRGTRIHGDINIIPVGLPSRWQTKESYAELSIRIPAAVIQGVAQDARIDPARIEIHDGFQIRDERLRLVASALLAEMEAGFTNGRLYSESLATALSVHLLQNFSNVPQQPSRARSPLAGYRLKTILSYIEDNLAGDLSLRKIAEVAGLSISHCKTTFRQSLNMPIHQYVLERRVARAKDLLMSGRSPSDVAGQTGFASQSHLALHVRRFLGVTPTELISSARGRSSGPR